VRQAKKYTTALPDLPGELTPKDRHQDEQVRVLDVKSKLVELDVSTTLETAVE
jgi:hypothetical protein